jgi:thioesterase domain-containing protein
LIAVHLMARIKRSYHVEYPLSVLFEAPTVARCAELLREEIGDDAGAAPERKKRPRTRREFLVRLNNVEESEKPPLFLVSGMLGNVLNLRHLAAHLGEDQPVWAIQARGLYGEAEPHKRFPQMAADYLSELREVQPEGPYYLGGFSGGGIAALEMAQQLRAADQEIGILIMLDTPAKIPGLTWGDRLHLQWRKLLEGGPTYPLEFIKHRWQWEKQRFQSRRSDSKEEVSPALFRSAQIEAAFREALDHYDIQPYPGKVTLFRPPLDEAYVLGPEKVVNHQMAFVTHDNHWNRYVTGETEVHVVPGEHNSMVLEPHVRVLADKLLECLEAAQREHADTEVGSESGEQSFPGSQPAAVSGAPRRT